MNYLLSSLFNSGGKVIIALLLTGTIYCTQSCSNLKGFQNSELNFVSNPKSSFIGLTEAIDLEEQASNSENNHAKVLNLLHSHQQVQELFSSSMDITAITASLVPSFNGGLSNSFLENAETNLVDPLAPSKDAETTYQLTVKTSNRKKAGTDARIYAQLIGSSGSSAESRLDKVGHNDFERSSQAVYFVSTSRDIGEIEKIIIRHDNHGKKPGWHLENVVVMNTKTSQTWNFPCSRWFAKTADDGRTRRTLFVNRGCN